MSRPAKLWIGAPLVVLCVLGALSTRPADEEEPRPETVVAPPRRAITALGRIEPRGGVVALGGFSEARLGEVLVAEGDAVEQDQVLYQLDAYPERLAESKLAELKLETAKQRLKSETKLAEQAVTSAATELRRVQEAEPVEMEAQQERVEFLVSRHETEQRSLERKEGLGTSISREALDEQRALVEQADKNLAAARAELRAQQVAHEISLLQAQAELERARILLERIDSLFPVAEAEAELARAQAALEAARVRAPRTGQILKLMKTQGERVGATPVLQMGDTGEMHVVAEVYETDIPLVTIGQRALVTNPTLEKPVAGEVIAIGLLVFKNDILDIDPLADVDTRVVEVRIRLEPDATVSRLTNLEVDVELQLPDREGDR